MQQQMSMPQKQSFPPPLSLLKEGANRPNSLHAHYNIFFQINHLNLQIAIWDMGTGSLSQPIIKIVSCIFLLHWGII